MIKVLYFASFRELLGTGSELVDPGDLKNVGDLLSDLKGRGEKWARVFADGQVIMIAVNQEMAEPATPIQDGDEVAFFPPVTGG